MATVTATSAASTAPVPGKPIPNGVLGVAWGVYTFPAEPGAADVLEICKVPAGATVIGGFLQTADLDTDATETIDMDVGWAANGVETADTDGFGNFGIQTGDASVHLPVAGVFLPFANVIQDAGYKTFTNETKIIVTFVDDPATYTAGAVKVVVFYV